MATVRKFIKFGEPLIEMKMPRPKRPEWDNKPPIVVYLNKPE